MTGAWEFVCSSPSTEHLLARLNALGGWQWRMGDSYWYGDYLAATPYDGVRIRIVDFPERWRMGGSTTRTSDVEASVRPQ